MDALLALVQRTVYVVPWPGGIEGWRTLVNRDGIAALPVFTDAHELEEAARRYGWLDARGEAPHAEVGARAALNYAVRENLSYVVVDIAAQHALEVGREEYEPLLTASARRDSQGPYAGAGKLSSSLIRAVRPTPPPGSIQAQQPSAIAPPPSSPGFSASSGFNPSASAATFGGGSSVTFAPLAGEPPDDLLDALTTVMRGYPEIEWACFASASRGPTAPVPTVGLRIDSGFRQRVNEIVGAVRRAADERGAAVDVLLLDDGNLMRSARGQGLVFYPWRK